VLRAAGETGTTQEQEDCQTVLGRLGRLELRKEMPATGLRSVGGTADFRFWQRDRWLQLKLLFIRTMYLTAFSI
jgi:hypothetical protein